MSRGTHNEELDRWLQNFASLNNVMVIESPNSDSDYIIDYQEGEIYLELRRGVDEELAAITGENGYVGEFAELGEDAGYQLDQSERRRPVITNK